MKSFTLNQCLLRYFDYAGVGTEFFKMKNGFDYKIEAIIFGSKEIKEYDRIYSVFSLEKGLQKVIGIGTRKIQARLASGLEPITWSDITLIKCKSLDRTRAVIIREQFLGVKKDLEVTLKIRRLFSVLERILTEQESFKELYFFICDFLKFADNSIAVGSLNQVKFNQLRLAIIWKALHMGGFQPQFYNCSFCGKELRGGSNLCFDPTEGVVCADCMKENHNYCFRLSVDCLKILRVFSQKDFEVVRRLVVSNTLIFELEKLTKSTLESFLDRRVIL